MENRILDISDTSAGLNVRHRQLVISHNEAVTTLPLNEVASLILAHPGIHLTQSVLAGLVTEHASVVICDEKRLPVGMILPLRGNSVQTERFSAQASASLPLKKQLWKQIIRAKVKSQAGLVQEFTGQDGGLKKLATRVLSGDTTNIEAQASRKYWPLLFGPGFRRVPGGQDPINSRLNYGYAVLRSLTLRAICSSGLHPTLGLHHHNRYNAFCLADDLMEPFRATVDDAVLKLSSDLPKTSPLNSESKGYLINRIIDASYDIEGDSRTIFDALSRLSSSLVHVFMDKRKKLTLPRRHERNV